MSAANQLPPVMSVVEFLVWDSPDGDRWELIDGTPHAMATTTPRHGAIQGEAGRLIGNHLAETRPACRIIVEAAIQPRVQANINARISDLAVTCAALGPDDKLVREPLVVIEVLSPSNTARTWANVWSYVTIPSVSEILVLHTVDIGADLLRRGKDGSWPDNPLPLGPGDTVTLESIGFAVPVAAFYRTT